MHFEKYKAYYLTLVGVLAAVAALAIFLGPAYIRHGLSALLTFRSAEASTPYRIEVKPGNTKVPCGSD